MPLPLIRFFTFGSIVAFFLYNMHTFLSGYYYFGYSTRLPKWLSSTLFPFLNSIVIFSLFYMKYKIFTVLFIYGFMIIIEFRLSYRATRISILFYANIICFLSMFFVQTSIAISAIVAGPSTSMMVVFRTPSLFYPTLFAACLIGMFCHIFSRRIISNRRSLQMVEHGKTLRFLTICLVGFNIYMLLSCLSLFIESLPAMFPIYFTATHIVLLCVFFFIMNYGIKDCYLTEFSIRSTTFEQQLSRQLLHYKSYEKYTDSLRIFRHDYKQMMRTVNHLLDTRQTEEARRLIAQINDQMQNDLGVHKKYSNNYLIDAVLQDTANLCDEKHIDFSAQVYMPSGIHCTDITTCRIATNLTNNAVEACENITDPNIKPYIALTSNLLNDWLTITIENSFEGKIRFDQDGIPISAKKQTDNHGLGLRSVRELIEQTGGLIVIDVDSQHHVFTVRLHLKNNNMPEQGEH